MLKSIKQWLSSRKGICRYCYADTEPGHDSCMACYSLEHRHLVMKKLGIS